MYRIFLTALLVIICNSKARSQNPLPDFSVEDFGNYKVRVSWINPFGEDCIQLTVQASIDSSRNFKTIFSTESPQLPQNGFVYTMPFPAKWYVRISYILVGNAFYSSASKSPFPISPIVNRIPQNEVADTTRIITVIAKDSVLAEMSYTNYMHFKDSIALRTKDTLFILSQEQVLLKPFDPYNIYTPSIYVKANEDGLIQIRLPDAGEKNYKLIFFDVDGKKLFVIKRVTESDLLIDKANFLHAGWFNFELYEDNKLKERNKILLQRDF